jgi:SPP1 gp7 family putative phage head morphogenesis protein
VRFDLPAMTKRATNRRRSSITLRPIQPTATMAGDLYASSFKAIIQAWQRAIDQIAARYERALPVTDAVSQSAPSNEGAKFNMPLHDSIFDLDSILTSIEGELQRLVLAITPGLRDWAIRAERWQRGKWRGAVLTATSIDLNTLLSAYDVSDTVEAFVSRNVGLIRSVSDEARHRIGDIVLRNYQARTPIATVAKEMREALGLSRARALRISADQSSKMAARLDQARQEQAGIASFKWRHSFKRHPRAAHVAHDGKVYRWDELPTLDGKPDRPGDAPFCGCRAMAVIDLS